MAKTMLDKIWDAHVVHQEEGQPALLYIDLHLVHEVTSPQAFEGLRLAGRKVRQPNLTIATADHNTPTWDLSLPVTDETIQEAARGPVNQLRRVRHHPVRPVQSPAGHSPHNRPGAGLHPAGQDHRLRGQPHRDPRRFRGAGLRDRDLGGGACAGNPDPAPSQAEEHGSEGGRPAPPGRNRQRYDPGHHRAHRHQRRCGPRHRIHRRGCAFPVHGRHV